MASPKIFIVRLHFTAHHTLLHYTHVNKASTCKPHPRGSVYANKKNGLSMALITVVNAIGFAFPPSANSFNLLLPPFLSLRKELLGGVKKNCFKGVLHCRLYERPVYTL